MKRLFWDIETSPNVVLSWRVGRKINIDHDNLLRERAIICIAWKWEGEDDVHSASWDKNQCDRPLLERFMAVADKADEIVAHNGDRFDMAWFRTRCLYHKLPPPPQYKTVDTLKLAKRHFLFNSNRMDYISRFLGMDGKMDTTFGLWKGIVLEKDRKAMAKMLEYCRKDVAILERVFQRMKGYVKPSTHEGVFAGADKWTCPRCASVNVKKNKKRITASGTVQHQMQCKACGGHYSISQKAHSDYLEAKHP